jgi:galactokinase
VSSSGSVVWRVDPPLVAGNSVSAGAGQSAAAAFVETICQQAFLDPSRDAVLARAPGRLDVMGGIADYSGSLVLQLPLALAAFAAAQLQPEPAITIRSVQAPQIGNDTEITIPLATLAPGGSAIAYDSARDLFGGAAAQGVASTRGAARGEVSVPEPRRDASDARWPRWAAYIVGALIVLGRERGVRLDRGVRILIDSQVPLGKGVSSSAAIEVAAMRAIASLYDQPLGGAELAILCQIVENRVVGAPCGLMDQMTASLGERDRLLALLCQPAELQPSVAVPSGFDVWGIDSGVRHAVTGSDYTSVRVAAFMGYRLIADLAGLEARSSPDSAATVTVVDPQWKGFLANITTNVWRDRFRDRIPVSMKGDEFLDRFGGTTDSVARVDPARSYAVRSATAHPVHEHERVSRFRELLEAADDATERETTGIGVQLGGLLNASHASYGECGLGSVATDRLVELVSEAGPERGLFGARITGGGSGGTVAILGRWGAEQVVHDIANRFRRETGRGGLVMHGSSDGAIRFGTPRLVAGRR